MPSVSDSLPYAMVEMIVVVKRSAQIGGWVKGVVCGLLANEVEGINEAKGVEDISDIGGNGKRCQNELV